jgi:hypothetical protein
MNTSIEGCDRDSSVFEHYIISLSNHTSPESSGVDYILYGSLKISFVMKYNLMSTDVSQADQSVQ